MDITKIDVTREVVRKAINALLDNELTIENVAACLPIEVAIHIGLQMDFPLTQNWLKGVIRANCTLEPSAYDSKPNEYAGRAMKLVTELTPEGIYKVHRIVSYMSLAGIDTRSNWLTFLEDNKEEENEHN